MRKRLRAQFYRQLFAKAGAEEAHRLADRLQVLALTHPEMLLEFEGFIGRDGGDTDPSSDQSGDAPAVKSKPEG